MTVVASGDWTSTAFQVGVTAVWLFCLRLSAVQRDTELEKVLGQAVLNALDSIHLTLKEAAPIMGIDEANLRSMLRGEGRYHLGLVHLARLPFAFWTWFGPTLFFLMAKRNLTALQDSLDLRKAS